MIMRKTDSCINQHSNQLGLWRLAHWVFFMLYIVCFLLMGFYLSTVVKFHLGYYYAMAFRLAFMGLAAGATMKKCGKEYEEAREREIC